MTPWGPARQSRSCRQGHPCNNNVPSRRQPQVLSANTPSPSLNALLSMCSLGQQGGGKQPWMEDARVGGLLQSLWQHSPCPGGRLMEGPHVLMAGLTHIHRAQSENHQILWNHKKKNQLNWTKLNSSTEWRTSKVGTRHHCLRKRKAVWPDSLLAIWEQQESHEGEPGRGEMTQGSQRQANGRHK